MSYQFERGQKPTGGVPPPVELHIEERPDGTRVALNNSAWWLPVERADGTRAVLPRHSAIELGPGDRVVEPRSHTEAVPADVLMKAESTGHREYSKAEWERVYDPETGEPRAEPLESGRWWWHERLLPPGHYVLRLAWASYGTARLTLDPLGVQVHDQVWVYRNHDAAWRAVLAWNGEGDPEGFYRCYQTGRRREDGTVESEHIQW